MRICLTLCILISLATSAVAQSVIDGDTLIVGRAKYRLCGIDAPELGYPGYHQAIGHLRKLIRGNNVRCVPVGQGTPCDGRLKPRIDEWIVAQCFVDGEDLAAEMVRSGHAVDWPQVSGGHYGR
jgi:endonuclease YncB( thermonuclease family)